MPVARGQKGVAQDMRRYAKGELHSGSKHGPVVKSRDQAVAIAMRSAGMPMKGHHSPGRGDGFDAESFRPVQASSWMGKQQPEKGGQVGQNAEASRMKRV